MVFPFLPLTIFPLNSASLGRLSLIIGYSITRKGVAWDCIFMTLGSSQSRVAGPNIRVAGVFRSDRSLGQEQGQLFSWAEAMMER